MITFKFVRLTLAVFVSHTVNVLVTDIILDITSQKHLIFTLLHIGSRLFEQKGTCKETTRKALKNPCFIIDECYLFFNYTRSSYE